MEVADSGEPRRLREVPDEWADERRPRAEYNPFLEMGEDATAGDAQAEEVEGENPDAPSIDELRRMLRRAGGAR